MMKKVLAITLVLGLAAVANATVSMTVPAEVEMGASGTIIVASDTGNVAFGGYVVVTDVAAGALGNGQILPASGDTGFWEDITADYPGWWFVQNGTSNPDLNPISDGDWFTIDYTALDETSLVAIELYDFDENLIGTASVQNTPEPMTLGLLGLGGLFLRRRR
jgi:MYXO-CTERM domain-containing protein